MIRGSFLANRPDLFAALQLAAHGLIRETTELQDALACVFVDAEYARAHGHAVLAERLEALQRNALAAIPELRAPCSSIDQVASEGETYQHEKQLRDLFYDPPPHLRPRPTFQVPRFRIKFRCEVCEEIGDCASRKAGIVVPTPWGALTSIRAAVPILDGEPEAFRLIVCCARCRRRSVQRCHHEQWEDSDRWIRCGQFAIGSPFCEEHRERIVERSRGRYDVRERKDAGERRSPRLLREEDYLFGRRHPRLLPCLPRPPARHA